MLLQAWSGRVQLLMTTNKCSDIFAKLVITKAVSHAEIPFSEGSLFGKAGIFLLWFWGVRELLFWFLAIVAFLIAVREDMHVWLCDGNAL